MTETHDVYLEAWTRHGAPFRLTWDAGVLAYRCERCGRSGVVQAEVDPEQIDVFRFQRLLDHDRTALQKLVDEGCPDLDGFFEDGELPSPEEAPIEVSKTYVALLRAAIDRAVEAHSARPGVRWVAEHSDYTYLSLMVRCDACGTECGDELRISEEDAGWIDGILDTEEESCAEYLVSQGCTHLRVNAS